MNTDEKGKEIRARQLNGIVIAFFFLCFYQCSSVVHLWFQIFFRALCSVEIGVITDECQQRGAGCRWRPGDIDRVAPEKRMPDPLSCHGGMLGTEIFPTCREICPACASGGIRADQDRSAEFLIETPISRQVRRSRQKRFPPRAVS